MVKKIDSVYSTDEYNRFRKLNGNREILERRKNIIKQSIQERGWIRNPIVVNEYMEIIDGQGRFEALKELELPIEYVISKGATIADCISLNIKQSNWKGADYVKCYADMGKEDYAILLGLYGKYPNLTDTSIGTIAGRNYTDSASGSLELKEGLFKIADKENLYDCLDFVNKCMGIVGRGKGRARSWCGIFKMVYYSEKIPNNIFIERIQKNIGLIVPCTSLKQAIECIEKAYNYGTRKNKVYFVPEYDAYLAKK